MAAPETNKVFLKTMLFDKLRILNNLFWCVNGMVAFAELNSRTFWLVFDEKTGKIKYIQT
jgi:hypothetical protein